MGSRRLTIPQVLGVFRLYYNHPVTFLSPLLKSKSYMKEGLAWIVHALLSLGTLCKSFENKAQ